MANTITCCKGCRDREFACHTTCERYKKEAAEHEEAMKLKRQKLSAEGKVTSYIVDSKEKLRKRSNRK